MRPRTSSGHARWLRLAVAGLTGAVRTARRRAALLSVTTAVVLAFGSSPVFAATDPSGSSPAATGDVLIGNAGMLTNLVQTGLAPALAPQGITIDSVGGMSLSIARSIRDGSLNADLFGSADANANQLLTGDTNGDKVRWFAAFARDSIVLAYSPHSRYLAQFQAAQRGDRPWYTPLEQPGVTVARSNPDDDPSGYYALFVAQLAEKFSGQTGLEQRILGDDRNPAQLIGPSSGNVVANLQSGRLDALFVYGSIATSLGLSSVPLPVEENLSDPAHETGYASASFTDADGTTFHGGVIRPSFAPIEGAPHTPAALAVLDYLFSPAGEALITAKGFLPSPVLVGGDATAVPDSLRRYIGGSVTHTALTVVRTLAFPGLPVILIAHVAPLAATGTIQFTDGTTALGAPVPVTAGFAFLTTSTLNTGTHELTAVFTPQNPVAVGPSTSPPVPLTVRPLF